MTASTDRRASGAPDSAITPEARALIDGSLVIDGHADSFGDAMKGVRSYLARAYEGQLDLPRQVEAGIDLSFQAVYTPPDHQGDGAYAYALDMASFVHAALRAGAGRLWLVREASELARLGEVPAILLVLEGASPLAGKIERLEILDALGFRAMGLTHDPANEAAGGCKAAPEQDRLTPFGRDLVAALDRRGWVIDAAHLGRSSLEELLALSAGPIVSSHTGMRALCDTPRNLDDAQVRAIAATGGLVGIDFVPEHLAKPLPATRDDFFRHVEHAVALVGSEHVAIGSDFDGYTTPLGGMRDAADYPWIAQRLLDAGHPADATRNILGENWKRVLAARLERRR